MAPVDAPFDLDRFAELPLESQISELEAASATRSPFDLLDACSRLRDPAPLCWLSRRVASLNLLSARPDQDRFTDLLLAQPDTTLLRLLRALLDGAAGPVRDTIGDVLVRFLDLVKLDRLTAMCLVDRGLKHHFPDRWESRVDLLATRCGEWIDAGTVDRIGLDMLAQVTGRAIPGLRQRADRAGPSVAAAFDALRTRLAREAIDVLERQPKAVSQSNAEELLARRVYTDPGHFLIELLQNAEDSGAKRWHVGFQRSRIVVWHDGLPFDARDLVGVTSIGQTTKKQQQIGFFGVGFKSVYEITDRPRLHSDVYDVEILDVSIPRALRERPADVPRDGTVLVLPLRRPDDPVRNAASLFGKARALDPCVLLTLRSIEEISLRLDTGEGEPQSYTIREITRPHDQGTVILEEPSGTRRHYLLQDDEFVYTAETRVAGKPDRTKIMVGVTTDGRGVPRPLESGSSTIYSYLPTAEESGLRFFVQGHFDLPVDRERISRDSRWNAWILSHVPQQLARLAERLSRRSPSAPGGARDELAGFLDVLPLAEETPGTLFQEIARGLGRALAGLPLLPCSDGGCYSPRETVVTSSRIAALFPDGVLLIPVQSGERQGQVAIRRLLDASLPDRCRAVARQLGCPEFDVEKLVALLDRSLAALPDGDQVGEESPVRFLDSRSLPQVESLYALLAEAIETQEWEGKKKQAAALRSRLRALPLVLGEDGGLYRAGEGNPPARAPAAIREVYRGIRRFVHPSLDESVAGRPAPEGSGEGPPASSRFLGVLAVPQLDLSTLVADLERHLGPVKGSLPDASRSPFPGGEDRLERIFAALAEASEKLLQRVVRLPLFPALDGRLHRAARDHTDRSGVLVVQPGPASDTLLELYASRRPIARPSAAVAVLERARTPALSVETLVGDLGAADSPFARDLESLLALHERLARLGEEFTARSRKDLLELPIWPDREGRARPLAGPGAALVPEDAGICEILPRHPFVHPSIVGLPHLRDLPVEKVGAPWIVSELARHARSLAGRRPDGSLPLVGGHEQVLRLLGYLCERVGTLPGSLLATIVRLPIFPDNDGILFALGNPRTEGARSLPFEPDLFDALADLGVSLLHPDAAPIVEPLREATGIPRAGVETLVSRVLALTREVVEQRSLDRHRLARIQERLVERRSDLGRLVPTLRQAGGLVSALASSPIWFTAGDIGVPGSAIVDPTAIEALLEPGSPERSELDRVRLDRESLGRYTALAPLLEPRSARDFLAELVRRLGRAGLGLAAQPPFLSTLDRVAACLGALLAGAAGSEPAPLPLVDQRGLLRLEPLKTADLSTIDLIRQLDLPVSVLHPDLLDRVRPAPKLQPLETAEVVALLEPALARPAGETGEGAVGPGQREALYGWMLSHQETLLTSARVRESLAGLAIFPTRGGRMLRARELVFDVDLPDLGIDWEPHPGIPRELLALVSRHLGAGAPGDRELIERHLLPAYRLAVEQRNLDRSVDILRFLARRCAHLSDAELRARLSPQGQELLLEDDRGALRPPAELFIPRRDIEPHVTDLFTDRLPRPNPARYDRSLESFLLDLGIRDLPDLARVRACLESPAGDVRRGRALAGLLGALFADQGEKLFAELPLETAAWLVDLGGKARRPGELFRQSRETETLIGRFPDLYPDPQALSLAGGPLSSRLGLRTMADVGLADVVRHVDLCREANHPLPFQVYEWLEFHLQSGRTAPEQVEEALRARAWVYATDEAFHDHRRVVGIYAPEYFGKRRGYWPRGPELCPRLSALMGIGTVVSVDQVVPFLEEVGREVDGDSRTLVAREPGLPAMILNGLAILGKEGRAVDRGWPVVVARPGGPVAAAGPAVVLVPASTKNLFRSMTPTLERLFVGAGEFFVAERGPVERQADLDRFHDAMGLRWLADAYTVALDTGSGTDVSAENATRTGSLREVLRALLEVLPRVARKRVDLAQGGWLHEARLAPLVAVGAIRVHRDLSVRYELDGVGTVRDTRRAVFDRDRNALLVDETIARSGRWDDPELAASLLEVVHADPAGSQLAELLEVLLGKGTADAMGEYLDRRHFPRVDRPTEPIERLLSRIREILDLGVAEVLTRRFPALAGLDLERWRAVDFLRRVRADLGGPTGDPAALAPRLVERMLAEIGVAHQGPGEDPVGRLLHAALAARTLSEVQRELLDPGVPLVDPVDFDVAQTILDAEKERISPPAAAGTPGDAAPRPAGEASPERAPAPAGDDRAARSGGPEQAAAVRDGPQELPVEPVPAAPPAARPWRALALLAALLVVWVVGSRAFEPGIEGAGPVPATRSPGPGTTGSAGPGSSPRRASPGRRADPAIVFLGLAVGLLALVFAARAVSARTGEAGREDDPAACGPEPAAPRPEPVLQPATGGPPPPGPPAAPAVTAPDAATAAPAPPQGGPAAVPEATAGEAFPTSAGEAGAGELPAQGGDVRPFAPGGSVGPQLAEATRWVPTEGEPCPYFIRFEPGVLPLPHTYAIHRIGARFDPANQRWDETGSPSTAAFARRGPTGQRVRFSGRLPPGTNQLPVPLYSRLVSLPRTPTPGATLRRTWNDGLGRVFVAIESPGPSDLVYEVEILAPPRVTEGSGRAPFEALAIPTVPAGALPKAVGAWLEEQRKKDCPTWLKVLAVQTFVRENYVYDERFKELSPVKSCLAALERGRGNHHLELLHASADAEALGRGVCYELNVLVVELLRHLGFPALVGTGWVLDKGRLDRPDHLFALAIAVTPDGPSLVPLDAAVSEGEIRRVTASRAAPAVEPPPTALPPVPGFFAVSTRTASTRRATRAGRLDTVAASEEHRIDKEARQTVDLVRQVARCLGRTLPPELVGAVKNAATVQARLSALRECLALLLGDADLVEPLLLVHTGRMSTVSDVTASLRSLESLGLVTIEAVPSYRVRPRRT